MSPQATDALNFKKLTEKVDNLENTNSILQNQLNMIQEQMAAMQNQLDIKLFLSNPSTVNLTGGT